MIYDTCNQSGDVGMTFDDFRNAYWKYELAGDLRVRLPAMGGESVKVGGFVIK